MLRDNIRCLASICSPILSVHCHPYFEKSEMLSKHGTSIPLPISQTKSNKLKIDLIKLRNSKTSTNELQEARCSIDRLLLIQEQYWCSRFHSNWLQWGDLSISYFHHHASQKKKQNTIKQISDQNRNTMTS